MQLDAPQKLTAEQAQDIRTAVLAAATCGGDPERITIELIAAFALIDAAMALGAAASSTAR